MSEIAPPLPPDLPPMDKKPSPQRVLSPLDTDELLRRVEDSSTERVLNALGGKHAATSGVAVEVTGGSLFEALCAYVRKNYSYCSLVASKAVQGDPEFDAGACEGESEVSLSLGFGSTVLEWEGRRLRLTHQAFGKPHWAGGRYHNLVITSEGDEPEEALIEQCVCRGSNSRAWDILAECC